jgi:hypothetical protein
MGNRIPKCCNEGEIQVPSITKLEEEHSILSRRHKATVLRDGPVTRLPCAQLGLSEPVKTINFASWEDAAGPNTPTSTAVAEVDPTCTKDVAIVDKNAAAKKVWAEATKNGGATNAVGPDSEVMALECENVVIRATSTSRSKFKSQFSVAGTTKITEMMNKVQELEARNAELKGVERGESSETLQERLAAVMMAREEHKNSTKFVATPPPGLNTPPPAGRSLDVPQSYAAASYSKLRDSESAPTVPPAPPQPAPQPAAPQPATVATAAAAPTTSKCTTPD